MAEKNKKQSFIIAGSTSDIPIVFTATDPINRTVILKQTTWDMHIIDGDNYRLELKDQEETVKDVVEDPKFIIRDPIDNRERYYDLVYLSSINKIKPLLVVVDHLYSTGDICTIFVQSRLRDEPGEREIIYERPKKR
ncbi:hypothetical protein [Thermoactinomyces mirandus]|uniref:Uncharacterized protein n=1 Tax=Thermoactinomyces mirandus TaxID=2756294 RepID=A0A7W2AQU8_9BACL|nr:hypothetical protein [Thermoactinomyces mirandus]MBA4601868.1 hypothetical protein [Thermoactinomyces mirandus]